MNRRRFFVSATLTSYLLYGMTLVSVDASDLKLGGNLDTTIKTTSLPSSSHRKMLLLSPDLKLGDNLDTTTKTTTLTSFSHRKMLLLSPGKGENRVEPERIGEKCKSSNIVVNQTTRDPMPNGIPSYKVEITNQCSSGYKISRIHISCGWFSSAKPVNPRVFKRIHFDDCLVNNGKPLPCDSRLSFHYANSFPYPLSVSFFTCS